MVRREKILAPETYRFKEIWFYKTYPLPASSVEQLILIHNTDPVRAHEEFIVDKWGINPLNVILEEEKKFNFWSRVKGYLFECTVIMIEKRDWLSECRYVKGIQVSIGPLHVRE